MFLARFWSEAAISWTYMDMFGNLDFGLRSTATAVSPCAGQKLRRVESGFLLRPSALPVCLENRDLGPLDGDN